MLNQPEAPRGAISSGLKRHAAGGLLGAVGSAAAGVGMAALGVGIGAIRNATGMLSGGQTGTPPSTPVPAPEVYDTVED